MREYSVSFILARWIYVPNFWKKAELFPYSHRLTSVWSSRKDCKIERKMVFSLIKVCKNVAVRLQPACTIKKYRFITKHVPVRRSFKISYWSTEQKTPRNDFLNLFRLRKFQRNLKGSFYRHKFRNKRLEKVCSKVPAGLRPVHILLRQY